MASLDIYIVTFNCARQPIDINLFASQLFNAHESPALPDILVLAIQELAPVPQSLIGGSFVVPYFARFEEAVRTAVRKYHGDAHNDYTLVSQEAVGMTGIIVWAKDRKAIEDVETAGVGVGPWQMGSKGAASVRFSFTDKTTDARTEFTFVSAHLAAMEEEVLRRNEDWKNIVRGLVFSSKKRTPENTHYLSQSDDERPLLSISPANASVFKPTSHLFVAGDLNYRTSIMKPAPDDYRRTFPQPHHPESSQQHYSKLYESDQLNQERLAGRTMQGLTEGRVSFPPTYKYDSTSRLTSEDEPSHWNWAKHRWPSWCDRVLFCDMPKWVKKQNPEAQITVQNYTSLPLMPTSDHQAVALSLSVPLLPIPEPDADEEEENTDPRIKPPFNIDPDWRSKRKNARTLEILVGLLMYSTSTKEGLAISFATVVGITGVTLILKSILAG